MAASELTEWDAISVAELQAWLAERMGIAQMTAREKLRVARALAEGLPAVGAALRAGEISYTQARAITRLPEADADTEASLVRAARAGCSAQRLENLVRRARDVLDPDGADARSLSDWDARRLHLSRTLEGRVAGTFDLPAEDGELLLEAIDRQLASARAGGVSAETPSPPLSEGVSAETPSTAPAQRRADALMVILRAGIEALQGQRPGRTHTRVMVHVDYDALVAKSDGAALAGGQTLSGEAARRRACDAGMHRLVTKGPSTVLDLGAGTRTVSDAQRLAVLARDGGCRVGCGHRGVDGHHIVHWADGGPTDLANLCALCWHHHRLVHEGHWTLTGDANGLVVFQPPTGPPILSLPAGPGQMTMAA